MREKKFVDEYIITGEEYTAAIRAGYAESTAKSDAYFWLNPETKKNQDEKKRRKFKQESYDYYLKKIDEINDAKIAEAVEVLQVLTSILRQELTEEVVTLNPVTGEYVTMLKKPSIAEVIKSAAELLKRYPISLELEKLSLEVERLKLLLASNEADSDDDITAFTFDRSEYNGDT